MVKIILLMSAALAACADTHADSLNEAADQTNMLAQVSSEDWQRLNRKWIYFGHQSVGRDIVNGVRDLIRANPEIRTGVQSGNTLVGSLFVDANVGRNGEPQAKIEDFVSTLLIAFPNDPGIAILKFCYADIVATTDTRRLFQQYQQAIARIRRARPNVQIVHATVPVLVRPEPTLRDRVAHMLGRRGGVDLNRKRAELNALLRETYAGKEPILDIARLESTAPDGSRSVDVIDGMEVESMAPEWTNDGGHLNQAGRRRVAEAFLVLLAKH